MENIPAISTPMLLLRTEQVLAVLIKYGFEDIITHPPFNRLIPKNQRLVPHRKGKSITDYTRYERIRMVCEELGTSYIKLAQIASNRPDLLPEDLILELTKLQDSAPKVPFEHIEKIMVDTFKKPLSELVESFDEKPLASASMAQVHRAVLTGGQEVVFKVQRPDIARKIEADIAILKKLAQVIENYFPQYVSFQPRELVKMFEKSIRKELKFNYEANNLKRFQNQFKHNNNVYVPNVYMEYVTDKILCMEYIEGYKITDLEQLRQIGFTGPELALLGINIYFEQVFDHGFFHADPHPGNLFILKNKKICFIDFGMMGTILDSDKMLLGDMLLAVHDRDVPGLKKALVKFSTDKTGIDQKELEYDIVDFFATYPDLSIDEIEGEEIFKTLYSLFFDYKIKIPANLLLLLKALVIIEGIGLTLDPKYNIIENITPFVLRLYQQKISPDKIRNRAISFFGKATSMLSAVPEDVQAVIKKLKEGKLHIEFEHKGLEEFYKKMEIVSNRMAFTMMLSALILGSSIIAGFNIPPHIYNVPVLGFVGFVISGLLAIRLIVSIIKHGNF